MTDVAAAEPLVAALLGAAGLPAQHQEIAALAALYPGLRRRMERLWAVPLGNGGPELPTAGPPTAGPPSTGQSTAGPELPLTGPPTAGEPNAGRAAPVGNGHAPRVAAPGAGGDLRFASVGELAAALRNGETTSVALVERYLAAADRLDPLLGTYVRRFDEAALAAAAAADAELAAGHDRGPLHGIPVGVKDILATDDGPTTAQSMALEPAWGRGGDGPVVRRLRAGGAIVIGKTQMMEFAIGYPDRRFHATETGQPGQPFRLPRNPWNPDHWTGGSSSGTGNGVAAGLFPMGIGTDTGGSIRLPAAYCGVTGHKPTFGLVPKNGCVPLGFSYDHIGPLARTVADCAAFLGVVAGADPGDPYAQPGPPVDYLGALGGSDGSLAGLRVGVARSVTVAGRYCTSGVAEAFEAAVTVLAEAGATVIEVEFPLWAELTTSCFSGFFAEALAWHRDRLATRWEDYGSDTRLSLAQGALLSAADLAQIQRVRGAGRRAAAQLFGEVDLVLTPTAGTPAFAFGASADRELRLGSLFTPVYNALGLPALAVPMGFEVGLPVSLQIAGPWFADGLVLRVGHAYQQRTAWHTRVPELAIDPGCA